MVAEHGDGRNPQRRELQREDARLLWKTVIGQVTRQEQQIGSLADLSEERLEGALTFAHNGGRQRPRRGRILPIRPLWSAVLSGAQPHLWRKRVVGGVRMITFVVVSKNRRRCLQDGACGASAARY